MIVKYLWPNNKQADRGGYINYATIYAIAGMGGSGSGADIVTEKEPFVCRQCGAPMRPGANRCDYCGTYYKEVRYE